jgi:hypothetical protein
MCPTRGALSYFGQTRRFGSPTGVRPLDNLSRCKNDNRYARMVKQPPEWQRIGNQLDAARTLGVPSARGLDQRLAVSFWLDVAGRNFTH